MKQRDTSLPGWIVKTKSKRYIGICPVCKKDITGVRQFRIQASEQIRYHLKTEHGLTEQEAKANGL